MLNFVYLEFLVELYLRGLWISTLVWYDIYTSIAFFRLFRGIRVI